MNNKIIGYEEAVERIKELSKYQRTSKRHRKVITRIQGQPYYSKLINDYKREINYLLSIIDAHKKMRKMYEELRFQKGLTKYFRDFND